jgi:hypothetical protein
MLETIRLLITNHVISKALKWFLVAAACGEKEEEVKSRRVPEK